MLSNLLRDFPNLLDRFTDSDCENGTNAYIIAPKKKPLKYGEIYYICDFHLGQLVKAGLTKEVVHYAQINPSASWNLPK